MANTIKDSTILKVINNTTGSFSFIGSDNKKVRFAKQEAVAKVSFGVLQDLYNESPNIFEDGMLLFDNNAVYDELKIPEEITKKLLPLNKVEDFLEKDAKEIESELKEMPKTIKENVAVVAKTKDIDSKKKTKAIKEATGFDVENYDD